MNFYSQQRRMGQGGPKPEKLQLVEDIRSLTIWDCLFMYKMLESYRTFNPSDYPVIMTEGDEEDILFTYSVEEQEKLFNRFSDIVECLSVDDFRRGSSLEKFKERERKKRLIEENIEKNRDRSRGWAKRELEQEKAMREKQRDGNE